MIWHNRIIVTTEFFKRYAPELSYAAFLSKSRDGEPIAYAIQTYRNASCIRVAHDSKHNALREMIARLKKAQDIVIITPDGPRGPRYKVKEGIVMAAKAAEAPVIPFTWESDKCWQLRTWDKFRIPRPFSTITISIGEPIWLDSKAPLAESALQLENGMLALQRTQDQNQNQDIQDIQRQLHK